MKQNNFNNTLKPFRNQVLKNSVLHSSIFGCIIGLIAAFIVTLVSWFFGYDKGLEVSILTFVSAAAVSSVILCLTKFRVTDVVVAQKVDRLGLKERAITMIELNDDTTEIAKLQREDAKEKLKMVSPKQIKMNAGKGALSSLWVSVILYAAAMVVLGFMTLGYIPSGLDLITPEAAPAEILVIYEADEGGIIEGLEDQIIVPGETTQPVLAVAEEGWIFIGWSDGLNDPYREGDIVQEDTIFIAFFEEIEPEEEAGSGGNGSGEGKGNQQGSGDVPGGGNGPTGPGNSVGDGIGESEGDGQGEGAGGKYAPSNMVIDGNTSYGDVFDSYFEDAMADVDSSTVEGDVIDGYFAGL